MLIPSESQSKASAVRVALELGDVNQPVIGDQRLQRGGDLTPGPRRVPLVTGVRPEPRGQPGADQDRVGLERRAG